MLTEAKKYLRLVLDYFRLNISAAMEYRTSFITQVTGMFLTTGIANSVFEFLINFSLYPEDIFKGYVRFFMYSLIPAGFIAFVPMRTIKAPEFGSILLVLAFSATYQAFAWFLFYRGLKKYESGNLIVNRM